MGHILRLRSCFLRHLHFIPPRCSDRFMKIKHKANLTLPKTAVFGTLCYSKILGTASEGSLCFSLDKGRVKLSVLIKKTRKIPEIRDRICEWVLLIIFPQIGWRIE